MRQDILRAIIENIHGQCSCICDCKTFKGDESLEQLASLFLSDEGIDFCIRNHFPNTSTFRLFKDCGLEKYGIYIDAGDIEIVNPEKVVLIGRTTAVVKCSSGGRHEVIALNGGKAIISASRWAVVVVKAQAGSTIVKNISENAVIL